MCPEKVRRVRCKRVGWYFRPLHVPRKDIIVTTVTLDELEALRLCDGMCLGQAAAAKRMKIRRSFLSRMLIVAREKVANALVHHYGIKIEGVPCKAGRRL